jgi:hypothetical protein
MTFTINGMSWDKFHELPAEEQEKYWDEMEKDLDDAIVSRLHTTPMKDWTLDDYTLLKRRGLYP